MSLLEIYKAIKQCFTTQTSYFGSTSPSNGCRCWCTPSRLYLNTQDRSFALATQSGGSMNAQWNTCMPSLGSLFYSANFGTDTAFSETFLTVRCCWDDPSSKSCWNFSLPVQPACSLCLAWCCGGRQQWLTSHATSTTRWPACLWGSSSSTTFSTLMLTAMLVPLRIHH